MESKYFIMITVGIIIVFGIMVSIASLDVFSTNNDNIVNDNNTFVVGVDVHIPPFAYENDNSNPVGFDLDLAQEVCDRNGWKLVVKPILWKEKEDELNSELIDCVWCCFVINGRENDYTWTEPYVNNKQVVIVRSDSGINSLSDLSGKNVEVLEGSTVEKLLENDKINFTLTFNRLISMVDYGKNFEDLESGVCDAITMDYNVARFMIKERGVDKYKILDEELCSEKLGIGFKKGNTELRDKVQETLNQMYEDGTVERIAEKYSDYGIPESIIYK